MEDQIKIEHHLEKLNLISDFYKSFSESDIILSRIKTEIKTRFNPSIYIYKSLFETTDNIKYILSKKQINDAYILLRKCWDLFMIDIYINLQENDLSIINGLEVEYNQKLENRFSGLLKDKSFETITLKPIIKNKIPFIENDFCKIRKKCNNMVHINYYQDIIENYDFEVQNKNPKILEIISEIEDLFIMHICSIFYIEPTYMMSSDYLDCMNSGFKPEAGMDKRVAPFIQNIFDKIIKNKKYEYFDKIKESSGMNLQ